MFTNLSINHVQRLGLNDPVEVQVILEFLDPTLNDLALISELKKMAKEVNEFKISPEV
jgi:hypothetical protein